MTRLVIALGLACSLAFGAATAAGAAPNPAGTGQPGAECGAAGAELAPAGFGTTGFAHAEEVYAGSDGTASAAHAGSDHAVSQYDVACVQVTTNRG
jgi:hypothetical protein